MTTPDEDPALTEADLPTLRRIRDLHWRWWSQGAPIDFTPDEARLYRHKVCYTAEWCGRIIDALERQMSADA